MGNRIGSIDIFRGLCIFIMFLSHLGIWWLSAEGYTFLSNWIWLPIARPIAKGSGFILVSGVSVALSYSKKIVDHRETYSKEAKTWRNNSFIRAIILFIIAILVNLLITSFDKTAKIFDWWILITLSICLFFTWPLMKLSLKSRIIFGISWLIFNFSLQQILMNYGHMLGMLEFLSDFFYPSDAGQNSIIPYFTFFIFGTVLGSLLANINFEKKANINDFLRTFTLPVILPAVGAIIFGLLFQFPNFQVANTTSFIIFALGLDTLILCVLITLEKNSNRDFNSKNNPLFYYSYYSLTLYALHYIFYPFGFLWSLDFMSFCVIFSIVLIPFTLFLVFMYKKVAGLFSIKYVVGVMSEFITVKIDEIKFKSEPKAFKNLISKLKINVVWEV